MEPRVLKAACADGRVIHWSPEWENTVLHVMKSESNSYQSIDYSPDGGFKFVCGGKLPCVEVYDEQTSKEIV